MGDNFGTTGAVSKALRVGKNYRIDVKAVEQALQDQENERTITKWIRAYKRELKQDDHNHFGLSVITKGRVTRVSTTCRKCKGIERWKLTRTAVGVRIECLRQITKCK